MRLLVLTALTMTAFAANSVLNRMAVGQGLVGPVAFALLRLGSGTAMLAGLILWRRLGRRGGLRAGSGGRLTGALSLILYLFGFSLAYGALDAGVGALILFGMVQITMFAGALIGREVVPARRWTGAGLAFAGLIWLMAPGVGAGGQGGLLPAGLMASAGVGWGVYSLSARGAADPLGATAWNFILALPIAVLVMAVLPTDPGAATMAPRGVMLAVLSGAVTSALGYALWYSILPALGAARAAVAQLTAPVLAALGGVLFLGEPVTLRFALAAALVLGGVALASLAPRRRSRRGAS